MSCLFPVKRSGQCCRRGRGGLPERVVVYVGASAVHQMTLVLVLATLLRENRQLPNVLVLGERVEE